MVQAIAARRGRPVQQSEASLSDIGRAIVRHWRWVALPTALAFVASLAFVMIVTPRYTGEAKLLLQASDSYFTRPSGEQRFEPTPLIDEQAVASQVQVIMSKDLARDAIRRLGLVGNPEFDPAAGSQTIRHILVKLGLARDLSDVPSEERVLEKYYDNLLVYPVGKSRIVAVEFRSKDPELAARAANMIATLYLGLQDDAKKDQARSATTWLGGNIDGLRKKVADAEAKVEEFRARTGLLTGAGTTTLSAQQLSDLSLQLAQARSAKSDAEAKARLIRDSIRDGKAFDIPDVANNELIRRLLEQRIALRTQLALELRTLMPGHPRIKELRAQVDDLDTQVRSAAERTVRTLENDARIAAARVDSLEAAINAQKKIVAAANESEVQLRALEREARTQREQLESYLTRFREASARDTNYGAPPDARIVSRAVEPQVPSFPKKLPIVGLSTLAMLVLSVGAIVARELLATPVAANGPYYGLNAAYPVEERDGSFDFDLSHLRSGPLLDGTVIAATDVAAEETPFELDHLIQRLERVRPRGQGRRILVTALPDRQPADDIAQGLARAVSRRARTILIEANSDETTPVEAVPGFTDLVAGEASYAQVIQRETRSRLHRVGTGTFVNEALLEFPDDVAGALSAFDRAYDWVFVVLLGEPKGDLLLAFARHVDAAVLASNLEPTNPDLVRAYEWLGEAGAPEVVVAREQASAMDRAA